MAEIRISISNEQECELLHHIQSRKSFLIDGGRIFDGEKWVFLKSITIEFAGAGKQLKNTGKIESELLDKS